MRGGQRLASKSSIDKTCLEENLAVQKEPTSICENEGIQRDRTSQSNEFTNDRIHRIVHIGRDRTSQSNESTNRKHQKTDEVSKLEYEAYLNCSSTGVNMVSYVT